MTRRTTRAIALVAVTAAVLLLAVPSARAGGPLVTSLGRPVLWSRTPVTGPAPLNSQTVDATGCVLYRVDSGTLGPLSNEQAVALVDRIFGLYNGIPTSTIRFANGGPILDPKSGKPVDVTSKNVGKFLGRKPTYQNPIIFDADGDITGGGGVLGFFSFLKFSDDYSSIEEGTVVLNGAAVAEVGGAIPFAGVFTHEFGHFAGPLDHEQSNGNIASYGMGATLPDGYSEAGAYDLYAPYTETLFPFLFDAPVGSALAADGFDNSGYFTGSLDMDTKNALSALYPTADYSATSPGSTHGAISGRVIIRTSDGEIPVTGVNVVARRIGQGAYPAPVGTLAYTDGRVSVDADGFPLLPTARAQTDSLETVESAVTGVGGPDGTYMLDGLPPGDYLVQIQQINPYAVGGSGIGPLYEQIALPFEESYNGPRESSDASDDPSDFVPVTVTADAVTGSIDVALNGFSTESTTSVVEVEPNDRSKDAQLLTLPAEVTGHVMYRDKHRTTIDLGRSLRWPIQDLYRFSLDHDATVVLSLQGEAQDQDADMWLFAGDVGGVVPFTSPKLIDLSLGPSTNELLVLRLPAGDYSVGLSALYSHADYTLRILTAT